MDKPNRSKRRAGNTGTKVLIAAASVAATVVGWAMLPANDPTPAGAAPQDTAQQQQIPAFGVPGTQDNGALQPGSDNQLPFGSGSDSNLPQVQLPQQSSGFQMPFTRSHSSR